jgi:hypothetical protein
MIHPSTDADPILEAYRRYRALNDEKDPFSAQAQAIRAGLVERWGEVRFARDAWERDPAHPELIRLIEKSNSLNSQLLDATDLIINTPATTLPGLLLKLQVALDVWPTRADEDPEYHEDAAIADAFPLVRPQDRVVEISARLVEGADSITLRHRAGAEPFELGKDVPHPMAALGTPPDLVQRELIASGLRLDESLQLKRVHHAQKPPR